MIDLENKVEYPNTNLSKQPRGNDIYGMFQTVSAVPTKEPVNWFNQIQIYVNGATHRLYVYDIISHSWKYSTLT
jgi:hypothetical protein